ncbi:MAG: hypothetical protein EZS28_012556 [Streblomastix strix]|uniref:Uncharacterized protein n=1 Tax=Streblomastix strix TaxID=222440 RepID=A0A5J4WBC4_9EUKA|nr:MAG: hypothetical protein EZS28_012556 [Streblomastix strix]
MQHDILPSMPIPPSVLPQYTVREVSRDQLLALAYTSYDLDAFKIYIIDDTVNNLVMFNMHLRQKGFIDTKQYLLSMSQSIDPKRTLLFPVIILYDFNNDPIQDIPSAYLIVADTDNPARWHIHISSQLKADNKGLQVAQSGLDLIYGNNCQDRVTDMTNFRNDVGNFIDEPRVRQSIQNNRFIRLHPNVSRSLNRAMGSNLAIPSNDSQNSIQEIDEEDF